MTTICKLIDDLKSNEKISNDKDIISQLDSIKEKSGSMEDRLLEYCNAIEDLGFKRIDRDYNKQ